MPETLQPTAVFDIIELALERSGAESSEAGLDGQFAARSSRAMIEP